MHIPVLKKEVIEYLEPRSNQNFIDATVGEGGHTEVILEKIAPKGKVLGIEWDPQLYLKTKLRMARFGERLILVNDSFSNLKRIVRDYGFKDIKGILFDLGVCLWHLEESKRGFSFQREEPLDMRYNPERQKITAAEILNNWSEAEIERILREYGEERFAKRIAKGIVEERKTKPIKTTFQLVEIIRRAFPLKYRFGRIHFATKSFQALRIAVNDELENLKKALWQALEVLDQGGKLAVISFHSLEDRIVKNFFRDWQKEKKLKIITKKPIRPSPEEIKSNPRARSAKLRVCQKQ